MSGKEEDISPTRVSRLKKRRRGGRESTDHNAGSICALQNLASGPSTKPNGRCNEVGDSVSSAARGEGYYKENLLNGNPSLYEYGKSSIGGSIGDHVGDDKGASVPGVDAKNAVEVTNNTNCMAHDDDTSILGFMDNMEQPTLNSAISSMLDIDMSKYKSTSEEFKQYLEQAFECKKNNHTDNNTKISMENRNSDGIYHCLVGRIDPHSISGTNTFGKNEKQYPIAFPQCTRSKCETTSQEEDDSNHDMIWQHLNLSRKLEHGMTIPPSWYQFPETKAQTKSQASVSGELSSTGMDGKRQPPEKSAWQDDGDKEKETEDSFSFNNFMDDNAYAQSDNRNDVEQPPASRNPPLSDVPHQAINKRQCIEEKREQQSTVTNNEAPSQSSMKYQGKIRIISNKGATIREVFDIDNSNLVIGKLYDGDERYFLEKKTLPPPPISLLDDSDDDDESDDDDDDDECVAVMRYKIALKPSDVVSSSQGKCNDMVGWISDRGRFADDSYLILREL